MQSLLLSASLSYLKQILILSADNFVYLLKLRVNMIILRNKFNKSFANEYFVEDVSDLVDAGCKDEFFCKVHSILHKHEKFEHSKDNEALVNILKHVLNKLNVNCTEFVKTSKPSVTKPIPVLLENLKVCKILNLNGTSWLNKG
uniref:Uncharacterized protein n=1 Tax=Cyprinodon variegatus TaxID=28743 RepID=A0A3Q2E8F3_CYPVA